MVGEEWFQQELRGSWDPCCLATERWGVCEGDRRSASGCVWMGVCLSDQKGEELSKLIVILCVAHSDHMP